MNFSIAILSLLMNYSDHVQEPILDGKFFIWKNEDNDIRLPKSSFVWFCNDSMRIVDSPFFDGGSMSYGIGPYNVNEETKSLECTISKSVLFSTNTGTVISYSKGHLGTIFLNFSKDSTSLQRNFGLFAFGLTLVEMLPEQYSTMTYNITHKSDFYLKGNCNYFLDNFEDESKLDYLEKKH